MQRHQARHLILLRKGDYSIILRLPVQLCVRNTVQSTHRTRTCR